MLTLDAIALGDAPPDDKRWARGELSRLKLADQDVAALRRARRRRRQPVLVPRATWPTWYLAEGTGTLFARTRWDERAIWFVTSCRGGMDRDHRHPDAGNFVLSRGDDDVIVDPSPYGSQSTLTSNAPTVRSAQLPHDYQPIAGGLGRPVVRLLHAAQVRRRSRRAATTPTRTSSRSASPTCPTRCATSS